MVKAAGLPLFGFFMIGFPWETKKDIEDTLAFIFKIDPDFIEVHVAMPYYGTGLYTQCLEYDTIRTVAWGFDYFTPNTIGTQTVTMEEIRKLKNKYLLIYYVGIFFYSSLSIGNAFTLYVSYYLLGFSSLFVNAILDVACDCLVSVGAD